MNELTDKEKAKILATLIDGLIEDAYQQGREDAIDEFRDKAQVQIDFLSDIPQCYMGKIYTMLDSIAEQIKEQKNDINISN